MKFLSALSVTLLFITFSACKTFPSDSSLVDVDVSQEAIDSVFDGKVGEGILVDNGLTRENRRTRVFPSDCGYEGSTVKPFKSDPDLQRVAWFDEPDIWRSRARPAPQNGCLETEEPTDDGRRCYLDYGMQFYPAMASGAGFDYRLVKGTSPIIRLYERDDTRENQTESCKFTGDSAVIIAMGIRNTGLATSWNRTDNELITSFLAWNRNRSLPGRTYELSPKIEKIPAIPSYLQVVDNRLTAIQGAKGSHDEQGIKKLIANMELAYKAGVNWLEIVSHSNGAISTQVALRLFSARLEKHKVRWRRTRNTNGNANAKMRIHIFHIQAAPARKWSFHALDSFDSYSNFLPNAKWTWRGRGPFGYWGWDWDFSIYDELQQNLDVKIAFLYNRPDWMTYDPFTTSTVGRRESLSWQSEVMENNPNHRRSVPIAHFRCEDESQEKCGPGHLQNETLWHFSNPAMSASNLPMQFELDMTTHASARRVGSSQIASARENVAMASEDTTGETSFPDVFCVNAIANEDYCRNAVPGERNDPTRALIQLPAFICASANETMTPCGLENCGDGICGLREKNSCPSDCRLPASYMTCQCGDGSCIEQKVECNVETGCTTVYASAGSECWCQDAQWRDIKCNSEMEHCEIVPLVGGGCSRIMSRSPRPGSVESTKCRNEECRNSATGFQLTSPLPAPLNSKIKMKN